MSSDKQHAESLRTAPYLAIEGAFPEVETRSPYVRGMPAPIAVSPGSRILALVRRRGAIALPLLLGGPALYAMGGAQTWRGVWKIEAGLNALVGLCWALAALVHAVRSMTLDRELKEEFDAASRAVLVKVETAPMTADGERQRGRAIANLERLQGLREKIGTRGS